MELYMATIKMGDMRLNINGYDITIFSNIIGRYSKTIRMLRDKGEKELVAQLSSIVKPYHVDSLLHCLYMGKIRYKNMCAAPPDAEAELVTHIAIDILIDFLCIDVNDISICANLQENFISGISDITFPHRNDDERTYSRINNFVKMLYNTDNKNIANWQRKELDVQSCYLNLLQQIKRPDMFMPKLPHFSDEVIDVIDADALDAARASIRMRRYLVTILRNANIPKIDKVVIWYTMACDAHNIFISMLTGSDTALNGSDKMLECEPITP
jgi:hypothetical protein